VPAAGGSREKQVRHVRTRDEEHQAHDDHERCAAQHGGFAHAGHEGSFRNGTHRDAPAPVHIRVFAFERCHDGLQIGFGAGPAIKPALLKEK
jgi:hypothetical protein